MKTPWRAIVVVFGLWAGSAAAQPWAMNLGINEAVNVTPFGHAGVYPYVGLSVAGPIGPLVFIPALSLEYSPDRARWGGIGKLTVQYSLSQSMGIDVHALIRHDQTELDSTTATYYAGGGAGVSFIFGKLSLSPCVSVLTRLNGSGWLVVPGINVSQSL